MTMDDPAARVSPKSDPAATTVSTASASATVSFQTTQQITPQEDVNIHLRIPNLRFDY